MLWWIEICMNTLSTGNCGFVNVFSLMFKWLQKSLDSVNVDQRRYFSKSLGGETKNLAEKYLPFSHLPSPLSCPSLSASFTVVLLFPALWGCNSWKNSNPGRATSRKVDSSVYLDHAASGCCPVGRRRRRHKARPMPHGEKDSRPIEWSMRQMMDGRQESYTLNFPVKCYASRSTLLR